jgi:hypothetical protein
MKTKLFSNKLKLEHRLMLCNLGKLTFMLFLLKGLFWLGLSGWFIYIGTSAG